MLSQLQIWPALWHQNKAIGLMRIDALFLCWSQPRRRFAYSVVRERAALLALFKLEFVRKLLLSSSFLSVCKILFQFVLKLVKSTLRGTKAGRLLGCTQVDDFVGLSVNVGGFFLA